ncbi:hypothetical protein PAHAL_9G340200 [Panicum hallii]|uniref:Uncharacterized protein n=1 Tax=Panicum hallii TaxID=206008 RepID=A0A2T8I3C5_9POAL|nr:hypothetical protein PAHAL_9G340200 [Panicum hallii]
MSEERGFRARLKARQASIFGCFLLLGGFGGKLPTEREGKDKWPHMEPAVSR